MMNYQMTLNELVTATEQARENYRRRGTLISRMLYEIWYVRLGTEALDQQTLTLRCPLALEEMYRLAIQAP
ncbi:hypothetical protein [Enterobacter sp. SLBN-59]|uniref:hypothetical protein n=1 Tax=Enterobacter sp. SLBN-59 TaxID=2940621 RepID=UPI00216AAE05|nr:hypothetical protein [Enterobacter sp. SLBN-59]MCS3490631.1 hypothetical protein [Enterobacter sp. SLBN-59]